MHSVQASVFSQKPDLFPLDFVNGADSDPWKEWGSFPYNRDTPKKLVFRLFSLKGTLAATHTHETGIPEWFLGVAACGKSGACHPHFLRGWVKQKVVEQALLLPIKQHLLAKVERPGTGPTQFRAVVLWLSCQTSPKEGS